MLNPYHFTGWIDQNSRRQIPSKFFWSQIALQNFGHILMAFQIFVLTFQTIPNVLLFGGLFDLSFFFSCNQAALRTLQSISLSICVFVCPSIVRCTFFTMFPSLYHHDILPLKNVIGLFRTVTPVRIHQWLWNDGPFCTVTPVWVYRWLWNDTQSLKLKYIYRKQVYK